jgi:tetratricopeptide (TPR) repeat protein
MALTVVAKTIPQTVTLEVQQRVKEALPHLEVVAEQWSHLLEDSTDAMGSFTVLARVAQGQSLWAEAEKWYQACLQMTEERCGADHPDTATSLNNLAVLYESMGRYPEAEPLYVRSLSIMEQQLGVTIPYGNEFEQSGRAIPCNGTLPGSRTLVCAIALDLRAKARS